MNKRTRYVYRNNEVRWTGKTATRKNELSKFGITMVPEVVHEVKVIGQQKKYWANKYNLYIVD